MSLFWSPEKIGLWETALVKFQSAEGLFGGLKYNYLSRFMLWLVLFIIDINGHKHPPTVSYSENKADPNSDRQHRWLSQLLLGPAFHTTVGSALG